MKCRYGVHKRIEYCLGNGFELSPDSIVIAVCWYTILVGYDVIQRKRRHLTCHLGSAILDFTIFLRGREISEVITTSNQNANEIYKFVNYCNWWTIVGKIQNYVKKVDFWPNAHEVSGCHGDAQNDGDTIDLSKFPRRMNENVVKPWNR